jgi:hypothetical protein
MKVKGLDISIEEMKKIEEEYEVREELIKLAKEKYPDLRYIDYIIVNIVISLIIVTVAIVGYIYSLNFWGKINFTKVLNKLLFIKENK